MTTTTTLLRHPTFLDCKIKEQDLSLMVLNWYWVTVIKKSDSKLFGKVSIVLKQEEEEAEMKG